MDTDTVIVIPLASVPTEEEEGKESGITLTDRQQ